MNRGLGYEGGGLILIIVHARSRMTIDSRIPTMPGRREGGYTGAKMLGME